MRRNVRLPRRINPFLLGRVLSRIEVDKKSRCWRVRGRTLQRRFHVSRDGECLLAHRYIYECLIGPIPAGLVIDHLCGNPGCQNPLHMEPVPHGENTRRGRSNLDRKTKTNCHRGHPLSGQNLVLEYDRAGIAHRRCRTCKVLIDRAYRERKKQLPEARDGNLIGPIDEYEPS